MKHFLGYFLVASLLVSPIGLWYLACGVGCFFSSRYCLNQWMALDILACTTIHGTFRRTISGYTGERLHLRRYRAQASVIDWLAERCGDTKNHCLRAYKWEQRTILGE